MPRRPPIRTSARPQVDVLRDAVRERMAAARRIAPGARPVVERFLDAMAAHGETPSTPSCATFDAAARSEATLGTLIRALEAYAPEVNLAAAREARSAWYARRPRKNPPRARGRAPLPPVAPPSWPAPWAALWSGLMTASMVDVSRRRYVAWVSELAAIQAGLGPWRWTRLDAWRLMDACRRAGLSPINTANLLGGLAAAGRHGGRTAAELAGVREMAAWMRGIAAMRTKVKVGQVAELMERGGLMAVADLIALLREEATRPPIWTACAARVRAAAAVLALELESWARRADLAGWMIGEHLVRRPSGVWSLRWIAHKNGMQREVGDLDDAIGEILDEHLLAGRPKVLAHRRYNQLIGRNFLTLEARRPDPRLPSELVLETLGMPIHPLRTVLADTLRGVAPELIALALGHTDPRSQDEYAALARGDAAAAVWAEIRGELGRPGRKRAA